MNKAQRNLAFKVLLQELGTDHDVKTEHCFHETRKWRFDVALVDVKVALEIDGGGWGWGKGHKKQGCHARAKQRLSDCEKDFYAMVLGWLVVRVDWEQVRDGIALYRVLSLAEMREETK
jgi:very-short-patch-repair endonuclease